MSDSRCPICEKAPRMARGRVCRRCYNRVKKGYEDRGERDPMDLQLDDPAVDRAAFERWWLNR